MKPIPQAAQILRKSSITMLAMFLVVVTIPVPVFAQDATGDPTGAPENTGAPAETGTPAEETGPQTCTGAGCGQGAGQGVDQGIDQGGPAPEEVGGVQDESGNWTFPSGGQEQLQGGIQGTNQGTGADSTNAVDTSTDTSNTTTVSNTAKDATSATLGATTGQNEASKNSGDAGISTGNAGIGVTQVKNDNTTAINGSAGVAVTGHNGDYEGDLNLAFSELQSLFSDTGASQSILAINDTTGQGSENTIAVDTTYEDITEVQNDGQIDNTLNLEAITGQNQASMNTGSGSIATGDANVAATLVNLLNSTVINGALFVAVHDIFGDLTGNINIPLLSQLAALYGGNSTTTSIDASNGETGSNSSNTIDIGLQQKEATTITNDADISTTVNAQTITGQNDALANTGGSEIDTGDGKISASNVSLANTTVEGGNWGLIIVNAFNRWVGLLIGDNGEVRELSQEETIREIEARNENTGADSTNSIDITSEENRVTSVNNDAVINNTINASAITGQNDASYNTGGGQIATGKAAIEATAVNIANTVVKDATLAIAVVNVFGDWVGDLMYDGSSLLSSLFGGPAHVAAIQGSNSNTGSESENTMNVDIHKEHTTDITNNANLDTTLNATIDTGNNRANKNTLGADIETGKGTLALHARNIANVTAIQDQEGLAVEFVGINDTTGFNSANKVNAKVNEERVINITNDAYVLSDFMAEVNTGGNEANMNTLGASIDTGSIDADVAVHNLINKVLLALGSDVALTAGGSNTISTESLAQALNRVTGQNSENKNTLEIVRDLLLNVLNDGMVQTLADLLFNTGENEMNANTCGDGCYSSVSVDAQEQESASSEENNVVQFEKVDGDTEGDQEGDQEETNEEQESIDSSNEVSIHNEQQKVSANEDSTESFVSEHQQVLGITNEAYSNTGENMPNNQTITDLVIGDLAAYSDASSIPRKPLVVLLIGSVAAAAGVALAQRKKQ